MRRKVILTLLGIGLIVVGVWGWVPADYSAEHCDFAQNGAWIDVDWTSQAVDETAVQTLATNAHNRQMTTLFPYVGYLKKDGGFTESAAYAEPFTRTFRQYNDGTRLLAWVGVPLKNDRSIGIQGWADLEDEETRRGIVAFVVDVVAAGQFDGVHLNVETVENNDDHFLALLDEAREALPSDKLISVAGSQWVPDALNRSIVKDFRWTTTYYQAVGERVDQIATMTYDSHTPHSVLYRTWMREQVAGISDSLAQIDVELLIGISVSREETGSHRPDTETLADGLAGLCAATAPDTPVDGVAIYADWDFSQSDQTIWDEWLKSMRYE